MTKRERSDEEQAPNETAGSADVILVSEELGPVEDATQRQAQQTVDTVEDDVYASSHDQTRATQELARRQ